MSLRIALLTDHLGHAERALLRGLSHHEFHLITLDNIDDDQAHLPRNVLSHTHLPHTLAQETSQWSTVEAAARRVCRAFPTNTTLDPQADRLLAAGLRALASVAAVDPNPPARASAPVGMIRPTFGAHPLGGLRLDALGPESLPRADADYLVAALRPLALRLPPVHVVHAVGAGAGLAALAHNWRRGTPYLISGTTLEGPLAGLCHRRAHGVIQAPIAIDPSEYPPGRPAPFPAQVMHVGPSATPLGAQHFAAGAVVAVTGGVSYPLIEAMMCSLPVVAVEEEGVADVVGDAGIVVPASKLDETCAQLLHEPIRRQELGLLARRRALRNHTIAGWLAEHEAQYKAAASPEKSVGV